MEEEEASLSRGSSALLPPPPGAPKGNDLGTLTISGHQLREHALRREERRKMGGDSRSCCAAPWKARVPGVCAVLRPRTCCR